MPTDYLERNSPAYPPEAEEWVELYPNPNNGSFTIEHNLNEENYVLEVMDIMGKVVHQEKMNSNKQTINTEQLSKGLYFVRLKTDAGKLTGVRKMIIEQ